MRQDCIDVLKAYDLPFECYFNACMEHEEVVHDEIEFIWLLEGKATIWCEGKTYNLLPDTVFIFYVHQKHSMKSEGYAFSASFRFKKDYLKKLNLYFERLPFKNRVFTFDELAYKYPEVPLIMSSLIELMKSPNASVNTRYQLISYYNMYVFDLYSVRLQEKYLDIKKKNYDTYLSRFQEISAYVDAHYSEKITLMNLADLTGISPSRLSHFFKEIVGISFQEYMNKVRLEKAVYALKHTDKSIRDVVASCGFSDQKYLNAVMKEYFHLTAHQYRRIMKEEIHFGVKDFSYPDMLGEFSRKLHKIKSGAAERSSTDSEKLNIGDAAVAEAARQ
jgi:AraC-like DNA-binding protein